MPNILNNYLTLPDCLQFIVRFTIVSTDVQGDIYKCNAYLRKLFNKKAPKAKIPLNGIRFISLLSTNRYQSSSEAIIVYNIVLDHLYSAIWLMCQLAPIEEVEEFCWIKRDIRVELRESMRARCRPMLFNIVSEIFNENKEVNMVEVGDVAVHIGFTGRENHDFNPLREPAYFWNKPHFRRIQTFGKYHATTLVPCSIRILWPTRYTLAMNNTIGRKTPHP